MGTPFQGMSSFVQRVTQWMSLICSRAPSCTRSSNDRRIGSLTRPKTRKSHVARSTRGTLPACSTGHLSV